MDTPVSGLRRVGNFVGGCLVVLGLITWIGCSGKESEEASSASKYRPSEDASTGNDSTAERVRQTLRGDGAEAEADGGATGGVADTSMASADRGSANAPPAGESPSSQSNGDGATNLPLAGATGSTPTPGTGGGLSLPSSLPGTILNAGQLEIPSGDLNKILAFIEKTGPRLSTTTSVEEQVQLIDVLIVAMDRALALGPEETQRGNLIQRKVEIMRHVASVDPEKYEADYLQVLNGLKTELNPELLFLGRLARVEYKLVLFRRQSDDATFQDLKAELIELLQAPGVNLQMVQTVQMIVQDMFLTDERERARDLLTSLAPILLASEYDELKSVGDSFLDQLLMAQLNFDQARTAAFDQEPGAADRLADLARQMLTERKPTAFLVNAALDAGLVFEVTHQYQRAIDLYRSINEISKGSDDQVASTLAATALRKAEVRLALIGQPFEVSGKLVNGLDFDWSLYQGKVVLVVFWATDWGNSLGEFQTMIELKQKYGAQGFEIVGVNVDENQAIVQQFLAQSPVTFQNVVSPNPDRIGLDSPMATKCGIAAAPFNLLLDREGKVIDLHLYRFGNDLEIRVGTALGIDPSLLPSPEINGPTEAEANGSEATGGEPSGSEPMGTEPMGTEQGDAGQGGAESGEGNGGDSLPTAEGPDSPDMSHRERAYPMPSPQGYRWISFMGVAEPIARGAQDETVSDEVDEENPYRAPADASTSDLVDFLLDLQDKPRSLLTRHGLIDAVADAADRILLDDQARPSHRRIAASEKLAAYHRAAIYDAAAQERLNEVVNEFSDWGDATIAAEVQFLQLESRALEADESLEPEARQALLEELVRYFSERKLEAKHLRLASAAVGVVNDLTNPDPMALSEERERWFKDLGEKFAESKDRQLASYGRRVSGQSSAAAVAGPAIGSMIEIAGMTSEGLPFDLSVYRGKVVVVDFWATWCGPCRRELPNVVATHAELQSRGFDVIGVSLDQDAEALAEFLAEEPLPWVTLSGAEAQATAQRCAVRAIPTMLLLDREGKLVAVANRIGELRGEIDRLLAAEADASDDH